MRTAVAVSLGSVVASALVAGLGWLATQRYLNTPVGGTAVARITVKRGQTLRPVLEELAGSGVLAHPGYLYGVARLQRHTAVRSGAYEIHADQSPDTILTVLNEGRSTLENFTVAEGLNRWQIRDLLAQAQWLDPRQFDKLCDDPKFLAANQVPGPTCEGYLYPETYKFARGVAPGALLSTMFQAFKRELAQVTQTLGRGPLALEPKQFMTLASIVEKETGQPLERPHIACVFYNRMRAHPPWKLETDPTVIYAATLMDPKFNGNLTRTHLRMDHPYNTYHVVGLPPGPIANPGRAAMEAVAQPVICKDYFFVSSNNGQHIFCPTLTCHAKAVTKWQVEYFHHSAKAKKRP